MRSWVRVISKTLKLKLIRAQTNENFGRSYGKEETFHRMHICLLELLPFSKIFCHGLAIFFLRVKWKIGTFESYHFETDPTIFDIM